MKLILISIWILLYTENGYCQKVTTDTTITCTQVAKELSYYWRLDSLANNGFRLYTFDRFLSCKIGVVYADELLNLLGKPSKVWTTNKGREYVYFYFDSNRMPKHYTGPQSCLFISFHFENDQNILSSISKGDIDI